METNTTDVIIEDQVSTMPVEPDETETQEVVTPVYRERFEYKLEIIPPYSIIQCRKATIIERDGVEVGRTYHRHVRSPGDDVSNDCTELKRCAAVLWTPAVVAAYEATLPQDEGVATMPAPEETEEVATMPSEEEVTTGTADIETEV